MITLQELREKTEEKKKENKIKKTSQKLNERKKKKGIELNELSIEAKGKIKQSVNHQPCKIIGQTEVRRFHG